MKKRTNLSKADLCRVGQITATQKKLHERNRGFIVLVIAVLVDEFDFSPEEVKDFCEGLDKLCELYLDKQEDVNLMKDNIEEYIGRGLFEEDEVKK